ncbi:Sterigmatocystin 8-O-methyltransferase [Talaromyces islandicus]|uniref:Sterigmatocystin 8-O-methyltransferase n=1 Tax=Talaromyces islandicus TaxID=28573 RepID=A0A0U1LY88_TALIS|nr:Sterigmatocystin 8-O-methyltransferase [Talaromyces islandicus]
MSSLTALAEELLAQSKRIDEILEQNGIPHTSFEEDTLELLPDRAQKLRWDLLDTSHIFRQLIRGPRLSGLDIAYSWTEQVVLRIIWRYKLASAIPINGSATYDEISATSGLGKSLVVRTIRTAMTLNIFDESEPGQVCHTAISRLLATDEGYYQSVGLQLEDIAPASLKLIEAWEKFGEDAGEPNQSAFSLNNGGRSLFTVLTEEPERAHRFDSAMKYAVEDKDFNFSDIINAFDWSTLDRPGSALVDIGGGYGQISQALAKKTQHLSFIVQDLQHVVEHGRQRLPSEFNGRISFEVQNFMEPQQPGRTPDAYLISRCLHNWSDHNCAVILRCLIPRLRKGSKVLIWDSVLDRRPVKKLSEKFNLQQDFIMATISNGKDRSVEEFSHVLELSDGRFKVESVQRPEGCKLSMIEVSWNP